jgi:hypothetical protein
MDYNYFGKGERSSEQNNIRTNSQMEISHGEGVGLKPIPQRIRNPLEF